jgi:dimethylhistidine N-methyltransferase
MEGGARVLRGPRPGARRTAGRTGRQRAVGALPASQGTAVAPRRRREEEHHGHSIREIAGNCRMSRSADAPSAASDPSAAAGALHDLAPDADQLRDDVLAGLAATPRSLPCKYFYDARGAALFERICELDEYYLTRTEWQILEERMDEIADSLGPRCRIVEFGAGSATKTRLLLAHLSDPVAYVPVDISCAQLERTAADLNADFPALEVLPVCADYTADFELPEPKRRPRRSVVFFPGSTIGNFEPAAASAFLRRAARVAGADGAVLVGADRDKDAAVIERAYNDAGGVTAEFNLNLLRRINRELGADFDLDGFVHRAFYDTARGRIEMQLVSRRDQRVRVPRPGRSPAEFRFRPDEGIVTEHSFKYAVDAFAMVARRAGLRVHRTWSDPAELFTIYLLHPA